jgi:integrase
MPLFQAAYRFQSRFRSPPLDSTLRERIQDALKAPSRPGVRKIATRLNAKGVGTRTIQKLMGHRHIGTTALYCDVSENTLRNAVELT